MFPVKLILVILSLLLSLVSGGRQEAHLREAAADSSHEGVECCYAESCFAAKGQALVDGGTFSSMSLRNTNSGRRITPQPRSASRIVKGGKVIDYNRTHPFLAPFFVPLSGMHISERYLLSICRLRL